MSKKRNFFGLFYLKDERQSFSLGTMAVCDINNTAHWIGVYKTNEEQSLINFLGAYLMFIAVAMVCCTVSYYQVQKRYLQMFLKWQMVWSESVDSIRIHFL